MEVNMRKYKNKNFWKDHIRKFRTLGITQAQYCRENNLSQNYFSRVFSRTIKADAERNNDFVEIIKTNKTAAGQITLKISDKYLIAIHEIFNAASLNSLLDILEKRL